MNCIEHIRYNHLVHQRGELLHLFDLGQLKLIGGIAACLPLQDFSLLYPFSFADLHLADHRSLPGSTHRCNRLSNAGSWMQPSNWQRKEKPRPWLLYRIKTGWSACWGWESRANID
jgi:hypothetical protein